MKTLFRNRLCGERVWASIVLLALAVSITPGVAADEGVPGTRNGWNPGAWRMTSNLGSSHLYVSGTQASCGTEEFKFSDHGSNGDGWHSIGGPIAFGSKFIGLSKSISANMTYACTPGRSYAFKWKGSEGVVFELSAAPVNIDRVTQNPEVIVGAQSVVVTATTNAVPPGEQTLWLRYTTANNWENSTVVKMTGGGTSYSAVIPAQKADTPVGYYVFSSGDVGSVSAADADLMALTSNTNGGKNFGYSSGARALWLDEATIGWAGKTASNYKLLYAPNGGLDVAAAATAAATACVFPAASTQCHVNLAASGTVSGFAKNPNATGLPRLMHALAHADIKVLLKGQVAVASYNGSTLVDISGVQIQGVLDALYAASAKTQNLGVTYNGNIPTLKVWAPTAKAVAIRRYADATTESFATHQLTEDANSGVWSITGDANWDRQYYHLSVQVYVPETNAVTTNVVSDPYSLSLSADTSHADDPRSQFVNLDDADLKPPGWDTFAKPALAHPEDIVIYEVHIRDFSINDDSVPMADRGTYNAFTYDSTGGHTLSNGMTHLKQLQQAGLTHIQLLPAFDFAMVNEDAANRTVWPNPTGYARDSEGPQDSVSQAHATDSFNWGYDPMHYGVPDGSYSTNPNGASRVLEFRRMVQALSENGLRVVMDVVYNHVFASGQDDKSVLDKVVPRYYLRYDSNGTLQQSSCCADTATEYEMMEKLMVGTLRRFALHYKVDGFRFDLMNLHTRQNMLNVKSNLQALTIAADGVDGSKIYLYGEGWNFGSAQTKGLTNCPNCYAWQENMKGAGIGLFNDGTRDAAHGGYSTDPVGIRTQGFINGLAYDWNGHYYSNRYQGNLNDATEKLRRGLKGGGQWSPEDPQETVNYVEKHDNETLFDQNVFKLPINTNMADRVRAQNMGVSLMGLAQGVPFFQMGQDILRSKSLDRDSYDSGDWFNRVDWTYSTNYFGSGLPPKNRNDKRWDIMRPLVRNTGLDPSPADIQFAAAHMREILRIRKSSPLFRLTTNADIADHVKVYDRDDAHNGLIVMKLSDRPSPNLDPNSKTILVFFNANKVAQTYTIAAMAGRGFTLHPVQADSVDADPVVQTATFNNSTGAFTIPARTTAVFVSN